jgi:hypothetical protein
MDTLPPFSLPGLAVSTSPATTAGRPLLTITRRRRSADGGEDDIGVTLVQVVAEAVVVRLLGPRFRSSWPGASRRANSRIGLLATGPFTAATEFGIIE